MRVNRRDTDKIKQIKALKLLVKMWLQKELRMTDQEWEELKITEITQSSNIDRDFIYVTFAESDDIHLVRSKSCNLSTNRDNPPRLINYIPKQAWSRYADLQEVAFNIRRKK